jgi:Bacteriophage HK97-gp10, putative tail-component
MSDEGFSGMSDLIEDLRRMGPAVEQEAQGIVRSSGELMVAELQRSYPAREGVLRARVILEEKTQLRIKVRSKAPHSHLFEDGTVQRFTARSGANRGTMPAKPTFRPAAVRIRRRMVEQLVDLVKRQRVRGMTGTMEVRGS